LRAQDAKPIINELPSWKY